MKKDNGTIYTIATAHLDTSWLWTYEKSVEEYIPDTFIRNFSYIKENPEYNFNFEGSLRYEILKEYYPELYSELKEHIAAGRWNPCGACYENGDVNIPSPEALFRNILYGNGFFKKEFGVKSNDIFIPDCFGFGRALPSVAAHAGLKGFSTCKLPWGASVDIPFDIGCWLGPDGKGVFSAVNPFSYTTIMKDIRRNRRILDKLEDNIKKYDLNKTFVYHGIGDRGGAPNKKSVKEAVNAVKENSENDIKVLSATTKEFFEDMDKLSKEDKDKLPVWNSEFLMTRHGTGSYTSRTVTKRWNRRSELLADAAERFSSAAYIHGFSAYPQYGFDNAWKKVIAHHFHDDITGTSFEECYLRSHGDYVQAMNTFSAEFTSACRSISDNLDTSFVEGFAVVVANPVQCASERKGAVSVKINSVSPFFIVRDKEGNVLPSQSRKLSAQMSEVTFIAAVPSCGVAVFDLCPSNEKKTIDTKLSISDNVIENKNLRVTLNSDGDIASVYDKRLSRELLKSPVKLGIYNNVHSFDWPAWEIKYEDIKEAPYMYPHSPEISISDEGPALCSLTIVRKAGKSVFRQIISLDAESEFVSVYNETDWREEASLLKAVFELASENKYADYDIGIGYTKRGNNTEKLYEVPAQKWAGINDNKDKFGVCIFSDSRTGWDKPDDSVLRLTCIHTPFANYRHECSQHIMDMGLNRYSFAVFGHDGDTEKAFPAADMFCQPMHAFVTDKHEGELGKEFSFVKINNDNVRISAIKKAQDTDDVIVRFFEVAGKEQKNVSAEFSSPIAFIDEVNGEEEVFSSYDAVDGRLIFSMMPNEIRSFLLKFTTEKKYADECAVKLDYNACGITSNENRGDGELNGNISVPAELVPESLLFSGVNYSFSKEKLNCVVCKGQIINVPEGFNTLKLLLTSLSDDIAADFIVNGKKIIATVQSATESLGMWDMMLLKKTGYIKPEAQAVTFSHIHKDYKDVIGQQFSLFTLELKAENLKNVQLPDNSNIVVFAATAVNCCYDFIKADEHFDRLEKRPFDYSFSDYAVKHSRPSLPERILDKFFDRTTCIHMVMDGCYNKNSLGDLYFIINNLIDKMKYKSRVCKLTETRKCNGGK